MPIINFHPGLFSILQAAQNYSLFKSDHIPILVHIPYALNGKDEFKILSWNVLVNDSANGVAPLGQGSYGEDAKQREDRYLSIASSLQHMVEENQPEIIALQEIVGCDNHPLFQRILKYLGTNWGYALDREGNIADKPDVITLYNKKVFHDAIVGGEYRTKLKTQNFLKNYISAEFALGEAYDNGDCFFDSLVQILNQNRNTEPYTIKDLRIQCYNYYLENKAEIDRLNEEDNAGLDQNDYYFIQYTTEECYQFNKRSPVWGRATIEGQILCRQLELEGICVLEELQDPISKQSSLSVQLVTATECKIISETTLLQVVTNPNIATIAIQHQSAHFVPVLQYNHALQNSSTFDAYPKTDGILLGNKVRLQLKDGPAIDVLNIHARFANHPRQHEIRIKNFLKQSNNHAIIVGDFNCCLAPLDTQPSNIITSIACSTMREGKFQGAHAIDGAFYSETRNGVKAYRQAWIEHLNPRTGKVYTPHQLKPIQHSEVTQKNEVETFYMTIAVDEEYKNQKMICKHFTLEQYENILKNQFQKPEITVHPARNLNNDHCIILHMGTYRELWDNLHKNNRDTHIKFRWEMNAETGSVMYLIAVPEKSLYDFVFKIDNTTEQSGFDEQKEFLKYKFTLQKYLDTQLERLHDLENHTRNPDKKKNINDKKLKLNELNTQLSQLSHIDDIKSNIIEPLKKITFDHRVTINNAHNAGDFILGFFNLFRNTKSYSDLQEALKFENKSSRCC